MRTINIVSIKQIVTSCCLITGILLIGSCASENQESAETESNVTKVQKVQVTSPELRSFNASVALSGTAIANKRVEIFPMENGMVRSITKDIGARVRKGEVIAQLLNPELVRMHQQLNAELDAKKAIYDRLQKTYDKTPAITPLQLLEDAKAEFLSAKAKRDAVNDRMGFLNVKAPFSGTITKRMVDVGALVQSGIVESNARPMFEMQEVDPIRLVIPFPEANAAAVKKGMEAVITFPELPGDPITGKISRTSNALDPASKTMEVQIDISNSAGDIKPGMYAKVDMQMESRDEVLSLPVQAQFIYQDEHFLLVVEDNVVKRIPLRKGLANKDFF